MNKENIERRDEVSSQNLNKNTGAVNGLPQSTGSEITSEGQAGQTNHTSTDRNHTSDNILSIFSPSPELPSDHQSLTNPEDEKILWRLRALLNRMAARAQGDFSE